MNYPIVDVPTADGASTYLAYRVELDGIILLVAKDLADIDPTYLQREVEDFRNSLHAQSS